MDYGMISKIEKAKRYAEQRDRISFLSFTVTFDGDNNPHSVMYEGGQWSCDCSFFQSRGVTFDGDNNPHSVMYEGGQWSCDCSFFQSRGVCSHTMALERILAGMLPESAAAQS